MFIVLLLPLRGLGSPSQRDFGVLFSVEAAPIQEIWRIVERISSRSVSLEATAIGWRMELAWPDAVTPAQVRMTVEEAG
jgi:hypothetical protein